MNTKVKELMKAYPVIVASGMSLKDAAKEMKEVECGVLPVGTWKNIEGIITDRDIVVRAVAEGVDVDTETVGDYMTAEVFYCNEDDTLQQAAEQMQQHNVSRLVVRNGEGDACGILTFGCILRKESDMEEVGEVVKCAIGKNAA